MLRRYRLKDLNFLLIFLLIGISVVGLLLVGSADDSLVSKQFLGLVAGVVLMLFIAFVDYSWVLYFYWLIYFVNLALLGAVIIMGIASHGAARWISIGGDNGLIFQPTELSKILLILFFAMYFSKHENDLNTFRTILKTAVLMAVPIIMVARQPDLKNAITITIVLCILMYIAGLSYKVIGKILLIVIPAFILVFVLITQTDLPILQDYQKERIMTFMDPSNEEYTESANQQNSSVTAIGSGQLHGKGLNNNEVTSSNKGNFVAETQNDFIFAVAGEELGFVGCAAIIAVLFLIVLLCIRTGNRAKDLSGKIICCGMASLVAIQSFINICVATGLLPNTGTPLPFISYGLTSLMSLFIGMGFVLNVGLQKSIYNKAPELKKLDKRVLG
ncbi:MAG: rod shape-determining protein RodA [Lachnospiraceae bacterium]|nr:rod shape-determining protein RodA [Lachnospiraceae bacterium]